MILDQYFTRLNESPHTCVRPGCGRPGIWRRQNTQYEDDFSNWACLCEDCQAEADEYWAEMWRCYYNERL